MIVIAAPGQGSQKPGFLTPWLERPQLHELVETLSEATGIDLVEAGTVSDAETIRDTAIAQPLIVAAGLVSAHALFAELEARGIPAASYASQLGYAGHSVGEITAAALAGVFAPEVAARFVRERSQAMAAASAVAPTTMAAVIGGDRAEVIARLDAVGAQPANFNSDAQLVAAGTVAQIEALAAEPPTRARVIPLSVAGAFHTVHMRPALDHLESLRDSFPASDPTAALWTNADGGIVDSGARYLDLLISQVASPVHWDSVQSSFVEHDVRALIELLPGGTLVGIAKRQLRGLPAVALTTPDDLTAAVDLLIEHLDAEVSPASIG